MLTEFHPCIMKMVSVNVEHSPAQFDQFPFIFDKRPLGLTTFFLLTMLVFFMLAGGKYVEGVVTLHHEDCVGESLQRLAFFSVLILLRVKHSTPFDQFPLS